MKTCLYYFTNHSSFVRKDLTIIGSKYQIHEFIFKPVPKSLTPVFFIKQLWHLISRIQSSHLIVCQFAGYHSFLPSLFGKLFNKPCLIVTGGTDCVAFPSLHYGNFANLLNGWFTCASFKLATHIAPVDESLIVCDYSYSSDDFPKQGAKFHCRNLKTPHTVIYNGYDADVWKPEGSRTPQSFITVAADMQTKRIQKLKGIDLILELAPFFPEYSFTLVGWNGEPPINLPPNVILLPPTENSKLPDLYSKHAYYLQLSISEGFPNALCEAMLCGCIPITSPVGAMPNILNNQGFILKNRDLNSLKSLVKTLDQNPQNPIQIRDSIAGRFPESRRKIELLELFSKLER